MRKRKGFYVLGTVAMLALAAGCGGKEGKNPENQVAEATSPIETQEVSEATPTSEPAVTPAPTATPKPANYMEANGIEVLGAGRYTCKGYVAEQWDENGEAIVELADCEYRFEFGGEESEGGTKIIRATIKTLPHVSQAGWSAYGTSGFVDLQTGKSFCLMESDMSQTTLLTREEGDIELQLSVETELPSVTNPYYKEIYTLVCPADYKDAGFYITGNRMEGDMFWEWVGEWRLLNYIKRGKADLLVFGVNKALEDIQEK